MGGSFNGEDNVHAAGLLGTEGLGVSADGYLKVGNVLADGGAFGYGVFIFFDKKSLLGAGLPAAFNLGKDCYAEKCVGLFGRYSYIDNVSGFAFGLEAVVDEVILSLIVFFVHRKFPVGLAGAGNLKCGAEGLAGIIGICEGLLVSVKSAFRKRTGARSRKNHGKYGKHRKYMSENFHMNSFLG